MAAITNYYKFNDLKPHKFIVTTLKLKTLNRSH